MTHAEILLPSGKVIGITPNKVAAVRELKGRHYPNTDWEIVSLEITDEEAGKIEEFYLKTEGDTYDWIGMILTHTTPFEVRRANRWYCSSWIANALRHAGIIECLHDKKNMSPGFLYEILKDLEKDR